MEILKNIQIVCMHTRLTGGAFWDFSKERGLIN
jgi:hypothetical protein